MSDRDPPLAPRERRRRTVILCTSFLRNLAIYRAGQTVGAQLLSREAPHYQFWLQVNSNCIDICVLEWCKLFADQNGEHFWRAVVAADRHEAFEDGLLQSVSMSAEDFAEYVRDFRRYRDRFVAHLDRDRTMYPPVLLSAEASVRYFFAHIVSQEAAPYDLIGLPSEWICLIVRTRSLRVKSKRFLIEPRIFSGWALRRVKRNTNGSKFR